MPTNQTTERRRPLLTWLCMISPFVLGLAYVTMGLHIRLGLGHWPKPMVENYQTLAFRIHEGAFFVVMLFTVFAAVPLWVVFLCFRRLRLSWRAHAAQALTYGLGWLVILVAGKLDPTTFTDWFLD